MDPIPLEAREEGYRIPLLPFRKARKTMRKKRQFLNAESMNRRGYSQRKRWIETDDEEYSFETWTQNRVDHLVSFLNKLEAEAQHHYDLLVKHQIDPNERIEKEKKPRKPKKKPRRMIQI
jgi:hypothetical protein